MSLQLPRISSVFAAPMPLALQAQGLCRKHSILRVTRGSLRQKNAHLTKCMIRCSHISGSGIRIARTMYSRLEHSSNAAMRMLYRILDLAHQGHNTLGSFRAPLPTPQRQVQQCHVFTSSSDRPAAMHFTGNMHSQLDILEQSLLEWPSHLWPHFPGGTCTDSVRLVYNFVCDASSWLLDCSAATVRPSPYQVTIDTDYYVDYTVERLKGCTE